MRTAGRRPQLERVMKRPPPASMRRGDRTPHSLSLSPTFFQPSCTFSQAVCSSCSISALHGTALW